jgi:hypothetical protein
MSLYNRFILAIASVQHASVFGPELVGSHNELLFDKAKSEFLLAHFKEGEFAYVRLGLPTQIGSISARFSLREFRQMLTKFRICNFL